MNKRLNPAEVSALQKVTPSENNVLEVKNTAEQVSELKQKLTQLQGKESLTEEDKLVVKQARELAEKLQERQYAKEIYTRQSKELLDLLKNFSEDKKQVLEAAKAQEQKLDSDVKQESVPVEIQEQKPLPREELKVQPKVKEIYVGKDVFSELCDLNGDGEISNGGDMWLISWYDVYKVLEKNRSNPDLVKNIGYVLWIEFAWLEWLEQALKENPELKNKFFNNLYLLAYSGVNITEVLKNGKKGVSDSVENFGNNLKLSQKVTESLSVGFEQKYSQSIAKLEESLSNPDLKPEERKKIEHLVQLYKSNKEAFLQSFKLNGAAMLLSFVESQKWVGLWGSVSNTQIDNFLKRSTDELISGMSLNIWFSYANGVLTPWVGVDFATRVFQVSENVNMNFNAGLFLTVPYLAGTLNYTYNKDDILKAGFQDFSTDQKRIGLTANVSTLWGWLTLHWSKDKLQAVETKEKQLKALLDSVMGEDFNPIQALATLKDNPNLSAEDKTYLEQFLLRINDMLKLTGYDIIDSVHKKIVVDGLKYAFINEWKTQIYTQAEKSGYNFTGAGIWIQFIAWFFPLPTAWVRFTDYKMWFTQDRNGKVMAMMSTSQLGKQDEVASTKVEWKDVVSGIDKLKNADVEAYLVKNMSKYDGTNLRAPSTIAMRNPKDYPQLLKALVWGNTQWAFEQLTKILKTDVLLRNDAETKALLKKFSSLWSDQKAYVMAQFMDVIFKDKNPIETVVRTDTEWKNRERGLAGVYTDKDVYKEVVTLRNATRSELLKDKSQKLPVAPVKGVMWFVASYKVWYVDGKQVSLGKWEAAIPPGLATVVGWEKWITKITDAKLVEHTLEDMKKTPYYGKLKASIEQVIATKYTGFKLDEATFDTLLKTGEIKIGEKTVKMNREFVFFLYGRCANETLWLRINGLDLWDGQPPITGIDFNSDGEMIIPNMPTLEERHYVLWAIGGDKKPDDGSWGSTPTPTPTQPGWGNGWETTWGVWNGGNNPGGSTWWNIP